MGVGVRARVLCRPRLHEVPRVKVMVGVRVGVRVRVRVGVRVRVAVRTVGG